MLQTLCTRADLEATGAKDVVFTVNGVRHSVVVVKDHDVIRAYVNSCPHARVPLNWQGDNFFDLSGTYLRCALHGAAFEVDTGKCVRGPAVGRGLRPVTVHVEGDTIMTDPAHLSA